MRTRISNDRWIQQHFTSIVTRYGGKVPYVFVAQGKVFPVKPGEDIRALEKRIRRRYGKPTGLPVPEPQDFLSVLILNLK